MGIITLRQAAQWCSGRIDPKYAEVAFFGACNDSRNIQPGQLFLALQGTRDGHDFIPMALDKGAAAVLCSRCQGDYPAIVVEDPLRALGDIARGERQRIGMKVVAVTGSVGKSTTKEMIACVLESRFRTEKTPANHNSDIGMPMSILSMPEDTQVAVLEMGMDNFGQIAYLSGIGQPDVAVIVNIGSMHIEHLGSRQGILKAKMEITQGMGPEGQLILNGDDDMLQMAPSMTDIPISWFGIENPVCQVRGSEIREEDGMLCFSITCGGSAITVALPLEGEHYIPDALAAASVGLQMGISMEEIRESLHAFRNMAGRQEIFEAKGCTIIQDCYNAGPESMAAALTVLGKRKGRRIAVLGDMLELGVTSQAEHYRIGRIAAEKAEIVLAYGPNRSRVISGAMTGGIPSERARSFEDRSAMAAALKSIARPGDVILFKGSHGMHMELVLNDFLKDET
ncbi:MAG: UDP-N-acetylmuramoyl-tripeptide--D-alanyl-D-alanine ligase [Faecousia sp.]